MRLQSLFKKRIHLATDASEMMLSQRNILMCAVYIVVIGICGGGIVCIACIDTV